MLISSNLVYCSHNENKKQRSGWDSPFNKIEWLSNMTDTFFEKFTRCAKVCGLFYLIMLSGCWLAGRANSDHVDCTLLQAVLVAKDMELEQYKAMNEDLQQQVVGLQMDTDKTSLAMLQQVGSQIIWTNVVSHSLSHSDMFNFSSQNRPCWRKMSTLSPWRNS